MKKYTYTWKRGSFLSSDGIHQVATYRMEPQGKPRAILQLCHGMCEHMGRYEEFASFLCERGFAVAGHDHLGHGYTARDAEELGYTAKSDGVGHMLCDLHTVTELVRQGREDVPLVLFGHSMGSFFARLYLATYPQSIDGAIICGTAGPQTPAAMGKLLARLNIALFGEKNRSKMLYALSIGAYEKQFPKGSPSHLWLSGDEEVREAYLADPFCTFRFTARAYYDLFDVLARVSQKRWAASLPKKMPVFLIAGEQDPVGSFGKGVRTVYAGMQAAGMERVSMKLYERDHHELIHETDKETVFSDVLNWLVQQGFGGKDECKDS